MNLNMHVSPLNTEVNMVHPADLKKGSTKLGSSNANAALVSKLFLSLQAQLDTDVVDDLFKHDNQC